MRLLRQPTRTLLLLPLLAACQGQVSPKPPIHLLQEMDFQNRYDPQEENSFFADGRATRPLVPGTVARGHLKEDARFYEGREEDGAFVTQWPLQITADIVKRGQQRFNIYCAVCHGQAGMADGLVVRRGMVPPPNFHDPRLQGLPVGQIFDTISNGVRNMPAYRLQIPEADRWAIVSYVRALQLSQMAGLKDVPPDVAAQKGWKTP